ncbi:MAG: glycosyltransferase family 4 protein [Clostridia bacterium]|nr:glycosyltransferase family 4 protein [Clostridia bacterium]
MNIGIFTDTYTPQINGVVISIETLANGMRKKGHNVYIFSPNDPALKDMPKDKIHEEYAYRLPSVPVPFSPEHRLAVGYYKKMYKKVKNLDLDIIHTQSEFSLGILGQIYGKKLNIPVMHTYHTMWSDYAHYITRIKNEKVNMPVAKLIQKFSKTFCDHTNAVISPSEKTKEALIKYGVKKPIMIIPTGMNLKPYKEHVPSNELKEMRKELGISDNDKVILFIGRVAEEKSIDVIINEFSKIKEQIKDVKLLIIGDGPAKKDLEHLAKKLHLSSDIIFAGKKPHEDIAKYYKLGDVFVNASTTETQGLTFVEAMAAGIPVVAKYDKNLTGVIKDDFSGSLFDDNEDFSRKVIKMLSDDEYRKNIISNAEDIANEYSVENFVSKVEIAYQSLIFDHTKKERKKWFHFGK